MNSRASFGVGAVVGGLALLAVAAPAAAGADLRLSKTANLNPAVAGGVLVYTLTVTNDGPDAASSVVVLDALPPQVTWLSDDCGAGPPQAGVVVCALGSLANAASESVQISVLVSPTATGTILNTASVSAAEPDPDPTDNQTQLSLDAGLAATIRSGSATKVGVTPTDGIGDTAIRVSGRFNLTGAVDLQGSTLTLEKLLSEDGTGGVGELVRALGGGSLLPQVLTPRRARPTDATYQSGDGARPSIRVDVKNRPRGSGQYEFSLTVRRAFIPTDPALCEPPEMDEPEETVLTTRFRLAGSGLNAQVAGTVAWKCFLDPDDKLRVRSGSGGQADPGDGAPSASLRTEILTSNPGADDVQLDASGSEDKAPGGIVAYQFRVETNSGALVAGPLAGPSSVQVVTLPPGDYRAYVTVTDNDGLTDSASRGFSIK